MTESIITTIITAISSFVSGLGGAFLDAFQNIFMIKTADGTFDGINDLGIFVLIFVGIAFGYGVIRWITGLFRNRG